MDGASVVARGDASEVFELVKEALDPIAKFVGQSVVRNGDCSASG
jgi:hypothetical protein